MKNADLHLYDAKKSPSLAKLSTDGKDFIEDRDAAEREFETLREELVAWQPKLYAQQTDKLLVVLQAMDAGGKDSTIRKVFGPINPQGVRVISFKQPSHRELAHDFLWRVHRDVPANGMIHVFNRSHYEDVLIARVDKLVPAKIWQQRYQQINDFERLLSESGTRILKFHLHISREEQRERFQDRLDNPDKHWKFAMHDLAKRKQWDAYETAYEAVLQKCSTAQAPWHVIPADRKWYRNLAITRVLVETLREMNPDYPPPEPGILDVKFE